jgi:hypothetical protein
MHTKFEIGDIVSVINEDQHTLSLGMILNVKPQHEGGSCSYTHEGHLQICRRPLIASYLVISCQDEGWASWFSEFSLLPLE